MDWDALEFFKEEINHDNAVVRMGAANRLHLIAIALGPQRTVGEFIPYLTTTIQSEPFCKDDEFLFIVAKQCAVISERAFISGNDEILVAPLEYLAAQEETLIREQAIQSLCQIVSRRASLVPKYLVPTLLRLASASEFFTARVSACGLLPIAYRLAFEDQKVNLREVFSSLCTDDAPMVRRAAASRMGDLISVCNKDVVLEHMIGIFKQLSNEDSQDTIRISCIDACLSIAKMLDTEENLEHTVPFIGKAVEDRSWRVRLGVAKNYDNLCTVFGQQIMSSHLITPFVNLVKDSEQEVRKEAVRVIEPCLSSQTPFTSEILQQYVLPLFDSLRLDQSQPVRMALAQVIGPVAWVVGTEATERLLLSIIIELLRDEFHDVRLGMASHLGLLCGVLCQGEDGMASSLTSIIQNIQNLFMDSHWRIREKVIEQVPTIAKLIGHEMFQSKFETLFLSSLRDSVHSVRETTVKRLKEIADAFGPLWTVDHFLPKLLEMYSQSTSYAYRVTTLQGLPQVSHQMSPDQVMQFIIPVLIKATKDGVANVRFCACQNIMWIAQNHDLGAAAINTVIKPALVDLQQDSDTDVQYFTQCAIAAC